jgi:hypothetical protein
LVLLIRSANWLFTNKYHNHLCFWGTAEATGTAFFLALPYSLGIFDVAYFFFGCFALGL